MTFPTDPLPSRLEITTHGHDEWLELDRWLDLHPNAQVGQWSKGRHNSEWLHVIYVSGPKQTDLPLQ